MENKVYVNTGKELFPVAEDLYGLFFEEINRAGDGGLYPEMIRNRSFEDSLVPAGCTVDEKHMVYFNKAGWPGAFNHGEGMDDWAAKVPYTDIPGWYCDGADMELVSGDTLNKNRECSLRVHFRPGGKLWNIGYAGVPLKEQAEYALYIFVKTDKHISLRAILENSEGVDCGSSEKRIEPSETWQRVDFELRSKAEDYNGRIAFCACEECEMLFGFTSLMPKETYKGHGLRADLAEMLKGLSPRFMRFPGGCVVEGLTEETAMRFSHTIGPVWERPSHNLMWHYRTSNGLGFHEYLQLCEDLDMEAMYVCNCGISCQARHGKGFSEESVKEFLQEALNALEYALGDKTTKYGAMRAEAGHPEPFKLKYVEIGNENWGPEYSERYKLFYKELKAAYPNVIYISNGHTEREGLPTEFADEHYYSTPEFFMENDNKFDSYDRKGPKIFLGEYAVNGGNTIASMECALAEAVFLTGVEKNQDIVRLSAYAPLFQNSDYTAWKPNLIVFDNHEVYGIPSYHAIALMGANRGKTVVDTRVEGDSRPPFYKGIPAIMCEKPGVEIKNPRINGKAADISRTVYGTWEEREGVYTLKQGGERHPFTGKSPEWNEAFENFIRGNRRPGAKDERDLMWVTFGNEDMEEYTFEVDLKFGKDNAVTLSSWNFHPETDAGCNEPKDFGWNLGSVRNQIWKIEDGTGVTDVKHFFDFNKPEPEKVPLNIDYSCFNTYKIVAGHSGYRCYINDVLVQEKKHVLHSVIYSAASTDEEEIILKLINTSGEELSVEIKFDCEIEEKITEQTLAAALDQVNSMENKENVSVKSSELIAESKNFIYKARPYSVNVLKAKRR